MSILFCRLLQPTRNFTPTQKIPKFEMENSKTRWKAAKNAWSYNFHAAEGFVSGHDQRRAHGAAIPVRNEVLQGVDQAFSFLELRDHDVAT